MRFGAVRFLQGRGTFDFCGGGAFDFFAAECGRLGRAAAQGAAAMAFGGAAQRLVRGVVVVVVVVVVVLAGRVRRWT